MMWRPPRPTTRSCSGSVSFLASSHAVSRASGGASGGIEPLLPHQLLGQEVGVAAEQDVGAPARHVRGDGDGLLAAGLRDDLGFALVVLGVEDLVRDAALLEEPREVLGLLDGDRAHQHGLALLVTLGDLVGLTASNFSRSVL